MKKRDAKKAALAGGMLLAVSLLSGCRPNEVPALYGPPLDYAPTEPPVLQEGDIPAPVYGPPADYDWEFDPALNDVETVYGPPSVFGLEEPEEEYEPQEAPEEDPELTVTAEGTEERP